MLIGILLIVFSVRRIRRAQSIKDAIGELRAQSIGELGTKWVVCSITALACLWVLWYHNVSDVSRYQAICDKGTNYSSTWVGELEASKTKTKIIEFTALVVLL